MAEPFPSVLGAGAMINWLTVENGDLSLFEDWYNFEHLPERVSTPGFLRARRFVATGENVGATDFLTIYETTDVTVLSSPAYLSKLDAPTELTRRVVPLFKEFRRSACRVTAVEGAGSTGRVLAVEMDAVSGEIVAAVRRQIAEHRLLSASLYEPDAQISAAKAATAEGRSTVSQRPAERPLLLLEPQRGTEQQLQRALPDIGPAREFELVFELLAAAADEGNPQ